MALCSGTARALPALVALALLSACARPPAPVYDRAARTDTGQAQERQRQRGTVTGKETHHVISPGDTLYAIAWRYDLDYRVLARWNNIREPYLIYAGQRLRLRAPVTKPQTPPPAPEPAPTSPPARLPKPEQAPAPDWTPPADTGVITWQWPTEGRLAKRNTPTAKKGIDIIGQHGQKILAAADGEVVYSSDGLRMYGSMVIIKHNATWLSAYAYNSALLVSEGDRVRAGQVISRMGQAPGRRSMLHFEIRKNGQPTDPLALLPKRRG